MAELADALGAALEEGAAHPSGLEGARAQYDSNAAAARDAHAIAIGEKLPRRGTPERRDYDATMRGLQRGRLAEGRLAGLLAAARARALAVAIAANIAEGRRNGLLMRLAAADWSPNGRPEYRRSRTQFMPAAAAGRARYTHIGPEAAGEILDAYEEESDELEEILLEAFAEAYGLPGLEVYAYAAEGVEIRVAE